MRAASSGQPLHRLARKLSPKSEVTAAQPGQSLPGSIGTVQSVNGDGTATVVYNGAPIPCQLFGDFVPVVGQGVFVLIEGTRNWCIGPVATAMQTWQGIAATIGYGSGVTDYGTGGAPEGQYRLIGDVVQMRGEIQGPNSSSWTVCTLAPGYAPTAPRVRPIPVVGGGYYEIAASGVITAFPPSGDTVLWLDSIEFSVS